MNNKKAEKSSSRLRSECRGRKQRGEAAIKSRSAGKGGKVPGESANLMEGLIQGRRKPAKFLGSEL